MYCIVFWLLEGTYSVIKYSDIVQPERDHDIGEEVTAKFGKKKYPAKIIRKGENHNELSAALKGIIARHRLISLKSIEVGDGEEQNERSTKKKQCQSTSVKGKELPQRKQSADALREKKLQQDKAREEKLEREEVLRNSKRNVIQLLDDQLLAAEESETDSFSSRSSSPMSESLFSNDKGHPTIANKVARSIFPVSCSNCTQLEKENRHLLERIDELTAMQSISTEIQSSYARPLAGVYEEQEFPLKNGMSELIQASGVYLHKDQLRTALNKAKPSMSLRMKTSQKEHRDGKKVCRYLLSVFFNNKQLQESSLTASPYSKYKPLNQQIVSNITAFSVLNSDTRRGEIKKAMRSCLTSKRCKSKKVEYTTA